jgi:hypothetical protein
VCKMSAANWDINMTKRWIFGVGAYWTVLCSFGVHAELPFFVNVVFCVRRSLCALKGRAGVFSIFAVRSRWWHLCHIDTYMSNDM